MTDLAAQSIRQRYNHLLDSISSERFLKMEGLGNEVPFFICPFKPEEFNDMNQMYTQLVNTLRNEKGIQVLKINLYDLTITILKDRKIWNKVLELEKSTSKMELKELLQGVLDSEKYLIPAIKKKMEEDEFDVMFITGVGEVFPYIRSHTVLNNLQSTAKDQPTVMFFPGEYNLSLEDGSTLNLFGKLPGDRYYRAFNIFHYQI
jgi:hypothetical protein